jgi:hypothetical protein
MSSYEFPVEKIELDLHNQSVKNMLKYFLFKHKSVYNFF